MYSQNYRTCTGIFYLDETNEWSNRFAAEPGTGQLNPLLNKTYEIVNHVITEVASLFHDDWFHGGGDEPVYNCWNQDEGIRNYQKEHNVTGVDLLGIFLKKELEIISNAKKTAILWEGNEKTMCNNSLPQGKKKGLIIVLCNFNFDIYFYFWNV